MSDLSVQIAGLPPTPAPPTYRVDWAALDALYPWIQAMRGVPQDPIFHAEGDVWTHVGMVCEAMAAMPSWRGLKAEDRAVLFAAALLHDVGKPACTRTDSQGTITSLGHSRKGSLMAREILWRMGAPMLLRERVASLVAHHMVPFWLIERDDPDRLAIEVSQSARCDHLAILAQADARGRVCPDQSRLLENIALFVATCEEQSCLRQPRRFATDHTRFMYFRQPGRQPDVEVYDDTICEVTLMSGLPGAGKDHWVREHAGGRPIISLDALRDELGVSPRGSQGVVIAEARERARALLRQGKSFIWNATNLTARLRSQPIELVTAYKARVAIIHIDVPADHIYAQNRERASIVPENVINRMVRQWEIPQRTEAHWVEWIERA